MIGIVVTAACELVLPAPAHRVRRTLVEPCVLDVERVPAKVQAK